MAIITSLLTSLFVAIIVVTIGFVVARVNRRRYDLIDSIWGLLFIAIAWSMVLVNAPGNGLAVIMALLVTIWGIRLSWHILRRWLRSTDEDRRYVELRKKWPARALDAQVFIRIYLVQAVLATVISLPVTLFIVAQPTFDVLVLVGAIIWVAGIGIEAAADRQLRLFLSNPANRGKLMTRGLWEYSRHPNYFGEMLLWWGIGIMGLGQAYGLYGLVGPVAITLLLLFVSGVPLAEKAMVGKPGWKAYAAKTSVLIPWPSK